MWISTEAVEADLDHSTGWTYEVRLKIISQTGSRGAISLAVDDQEATAGGLSGIQIHANRTQWAIDSADASTENNDDTFHIFRLAEEANSEEVHLWRDGQFLGSHTGGHDFSQSSLLKYVLCGSWSSQLAGAVEIDYIRWDPTGAYAPYSPLNIDDGGGLEVSEHGPTSGSFTMALDTQPSDDVVVTVRCADGQIVLGDTGEILVELVYTSSDWGAKTVNVTAVDDALAEGVHTANITIATSSEDTNYDGLANYLNVTVVDNDVALALVGSDSLTVDENGPTSDSYEIHCLQQPTSDVEIMVSGDYDKLTFGAAGASSITVTFTSVNWQYPATVTVSAADETGWNRLMNYPVIHTVSSFDSRFDGYDLGSLTVRVNDNDHVHAMPNGYTIPTVDMDQLHRQVEVDKEDGVYLAHPTTVLLEDGYTMLAVYPRGSHARGECVIKRSIDGGLTWGNRLGFPGRPD
ncbi:MAG: hypothetical protein KAS23_15875, partial [Anaerohalosphaera sp.]|nr:hypothetical protein [Anaerohalosphaera sp.]